MPNLSITHCPNGTGLSWFLDATTADKVPGCTVSTAVGCYSTEDEARQEAVKLRKAAPKSKAWHKGFNARAFGYAIGALADLSSVTSESFRFEWEQGWHAADLLDA